jgi:hypothetical protein
METRTMKKMKDYLTKKSGIKEKFIPDPDQQHCLRVENP